MLHPSRSTDVTLLIKNLFWDRQTYVRPKENPFYQNLRLLIVSDACRKHLSMEVKPKSKEKNRQWFWLFPILNPFHSMCYDIWCPHSRNLNLYKYFTSMFASVIIMRSLFNSVYRESVSIVLILGVATTLNAVQDLLGEQCRAKFTPIVFQAQPSVIFLNSVLEKVHFNKLSLLFSVAIIVIKFAIRRCSWLLIARFN